MTNGTPRPLPEHPDLDWLRKRAKQRLQTLRRENPEAQLATAQFALAGEYGFPSWRALKAHVERLSVRPILASALEQVELVPGPAKAAALLRLARVFGVVDRGRAESLLDRGVAIADALREPGRRILLTQAASLAATVSPERSMLLFRSIYPGLERHMLQAQLIQDVVMHGAATHAIDFVMQADWLEHPLAKAAMVLRAADEDSRPQLVQRVVRFALDAAGKHSRSRVRSSYLAGFLSQWWRLLPLDEALTATRALVRLILEEPDQAVRSRFDRVSFTSSRQLRLFEIFELVEQLDPALAAELMTRHPQLSEGLARQCGGSAPADKAPGGDNHTRHSTAPSQEFIVDYVYAGGAMSAIHGSARTAYREAIDHASRLLALDSASAVSSGIPQDVWPSTEVYRAILFGAGQHEGIAATKYLERVPDPALRLLAQIELAASLVGLPRVVGVTIPPPQVSRATSAPTPALQQTARRTQTSRPSRAASCDVHVAASTRSAHDGASGGEGDDYWLLENAALAGVVSQVYDVPYSRLHILPELGSARYDFTLVLPRAEPREMRVERMRKALERHFNVRREWRMVDVQVVTAPGGVKAIEVSGAGVPAVPLAREALDALARSVMTTTAAGTLTTLAIRETLTIAGLCARLEQLTFGVMVDETGTSVPYAIDVALDVPDSPIFERVCVQAFLGKLYDDLGLVVTPARRAIEMVVAGPEAG